MDFSDNFNPKPIRGEQYTTADGKIIIVDDIQSDEGIVYVFCHYEGAEPFTLSPNKEEWEQMFAIGGSVGDPSDAKTKQDASVENEPKEDTGYDSVDNKPKNDAEDAPVDDKTKTDTVTASDVDDEYNEYLQKVLEPINRLKKLLHKGVSLPFQILKLETEEDIPSQFSDPYVTNTCKEELDAIYKLRAEGEKKENHCSWVQEKMWSFGAFDKPLLRMFRQDHGAKTGLGAAIFMTSLLAFCTGTYAFYKVSGNTFLAFVVGLIWGTMIYVLDRNIVTSMAYTGNRNKTHQFLRSCCTVGLRLIISVFIGIVISTPFEMLIFSGKIDEYKDFEHKKFVENYLDDKVKHDNEMVVSIQCEIDSLKKELVNEQTVNPHGVSVPGVVYRGPRYYALDGEIKAKQKELQTWKNNINTAKKIDKIRYEKEAEELWSEKQKYYDLSTDLEILYKITAEVDKGSTKHVSKKVVADLQKSSTTVNKTLKKDTAEKQKTDTLKSPMKIDVPNEIQNAVINPALPTDNTMYHCRLFITIFFTLLEVIPVITKLFFKAGAYDKKLVRLAYLEEKMHRIENANSFNQTINGTLSSQRKYILGDEYDDIEQSLRSDENHEDGDINDIDNIALPVKGCLRTAKDYIDWKNLRIWKSTVNKAYDYMEEEINKLFPNVAPKSSSNSQPVKTKPVSNQDDPSSEGEVII